MIYVATVHFKTGKWIDPQLGYLDRTLTEPYRVVASYQGVPAEYNDRPWRVVHTEGPPATHAGKLNLLAAEIAQIADPDDLIMFLDGDAFPVVDPMPVVRKGLDSGILVAVQRREVWGDVQPHPCFCVIRVADWERLHGDWSAGFSWTTDRGTLHTDVGGNLLGALERTGIPWTPILRTNQVNPHPLFFGIYGDAVYHHGAGFRPSITRHEWDAEPSRHGHLESAPLVGTLARKAGSARIRRHEQRAAEANRQLADQWFGLLCRDPDFYRKLL